MDREIYIGENGLEHCSVCKEPIQEFFPENVQKLFEKKTHPRFCACRRSEHEREESERKEREHQQEVRRIPQFVFRSVLCGNGVLPMMMVLIRI